VMHISFCRLYLTPRSWEGLAAFPGYSGCMYCS
jgi:hypothetical protein